MIPPRSARLDRARPVPPGGTWADGLLPAERPVSRGKATRPARALWAMRPLRAVLALACVLGACGDQGPLSGAGALTATLVSPHGPEGAAVVELIADRLGEVTPLGQTEVHAHAGTGRTRVVLIHPSGGTLAFSVAVADTTRPPAYVVREVAAPDDRLRPTTAGYVLELSR